MPGETYTNRIKVDHSAALDALGDLAKGEGAHIALGYELSLSTSLYYLQNNSRLESV